MRNPTPSSSSSLKALFLFSVIGITTGCVFGSGFNQKLLTEPIQNSIMDSHIHTVLFQNATWEFSLPVIRLGTEDKLELQFDDLRDNQQNLGYTFIHCDAQWKISNLMPQEFLSGFGKGVITDIRSSINTDISYNHYRIILPEENCMPLISGNYAVVVYNESNPDEIILIRRFYISENSVLPAIRLKQPSYGIERETGQQLQFSFSYNTGEIRDPLHELYAVVIQNNRTDQKLEWDKPYQTTFGVLDYSDPDGNIMNAGNEFRSIDLKSMKYQTENIAEIKQVYPAFHVTLKVDERRSTKPYFSKTDLNGSFYIDKENTNDRHTEADYVYVHFRLSLPPLYSGHTIYVAGAFTDWSYTPEYRMKYNEDSGIFESTLIMKQGLYDYCYITEDRDSGNLNEYEIEGSYYETRNDYYLFIYQHDLRAGHDRLISFQPAK